MLLSNANTAPTQMPTKRNGSEMSQTRGAKTRTANATGHERTNKMHQIMKMPRNFTLRLLCATQRAKLTRRVEREVRRHLRQCEHRRSSYASCAQDGIQHLRPRSWRSLGVATIGRHSPTH